MIDTVPRAVRATRRRRRTVLAAVLSAAGLALPLVLARAAEAGSVDRLTVIATMDLENGTIIGDRRHCTVTAFGQIDINRSDRTSFSHGCEQTTGTVEFTVIGGFGLDVCGREPHGLPVRLKITTKSQDDWFAGTAENEIRVCATTGTDSTTLSTYGRTSSGTFRIGFTLS